jgi:glycosyltransferase involved in cell wall biosynthesis
MKIVNVNQNHYVRGGSDAYYFALGDLLASDGHTVVSFASSQAKNEFSEWSSYFPDPVDFETPAPTDALRFIYSPSAARSMERLVREQRPDLAHLHIYYGQLTGSILAPLRRQGIPVVQTLHEYKIVCPTSHLISNGRVCEDCNGSNFFNAVINRCNRGSLVRSSLSAIETFVSRRLGAIDHVDHFLAVSDFLRDKVISLGVPADKVTTVHNFIDVSRFSPSSAVGSYVLYFGRLERMKGISTLLQAMERLPDVKLLIVGDGKDRVLFETTVQLSGQRNVEFLGFRRGEELHRLIRGSLCTVTPSEWFETFGLTLVESFALGRPVVCSNMGGMPEIVSHGDDGLIFESGDVAQLAEHLGWMARNPVEAAAMGGRGRGKVERKFGAPAHLAALNALYGRVVKHG